MPSEIEIEVFRVGPASRGITECDLDQVVSTYDADAAPAPLVIGHPQHDKPAHGVITKVRRAGAKLYATLRDISQDAVNGVAEGRYLNRSIAFWHPTHEANPTPGRWNVRHLGLLGAASPGIPNMSRLAFTADGAAIVGSSPADPAIYSGYVQFSADDPRPTSVQAEEIGRIAHAMVANGRARTFDEALGKLEWRG